MEGLTSPAVTPDLIRGPAFLGGICKRQRDPSEFTNEVQHLTQVLPCRPTTSFRLRSDVRLPGFAKPGNRSAKSLQLWIARHHPSRVS